MNDALILRHLEELAERIGITVRYESVTVEHSPVGGGLCRINDRYALIVHSRAPVREKVRIVAQALRQFDVSEMYVRPAIRELLEESDR